MIRTLKTLDPWRPAVAATPAFAAVALVAVALAAFGGLAPNANVRASTAPESEVVATRAGAVEHEGAAVDLSGLEAALSRRMSLARPGDRRVHLIASAGASPALVARVGAAVRRAGADEIAVESSAKEEAASERAIVPESRPRGAADSLAAAREFLLTLPRSSTDLARSGDRRGGGSILAAGEESTSSLAEASAGGGGGLRRRTAVIESASRRRVISGANAPRRVVRQPRDLPRPELKYPSDAAKAEVEGAVVVRVHISKEGTVARQEIVRAEPPGHFEKAVEEYVAKWRFSPAVDDLGRPVEFAKDFRIQFKLEDSTP